MNHTEKDNAESVEKDEAAFGQACSRMKRKSIHSSVVENIDDKSLRDGAWLLRGAV